MPTELGRSNVCHSNCIKLPWLFCCVLVHVFIFQKVNDITNHVLKCLASIGSILPKLQYSVFHKTERWVLYYVIYFSLVDVMFLISPVPIISTGKKLAESIVKEKLAACVNIVPGMCTFWTSGRHLKVTEWIAHGSEKILCQQYL